MISQWFSSTPPGQNATCPHQVPQPDSSPGTQSPFPRHSKTLTICLNHLHMALDPCAELSFHPNIFHLTFNNCLLSLGMFGIHNSSLFSEDKQPIDQVPCQGCYIQRGCNPDYTPVRRCWSSHTWIYNRRQSPPWASPRTFVCPGSCWLWPPVCCGQKM